MFAPRSGNELVVDYPELNRLDSFSRLSEPEQLFVYYYAIRTSPAFHISDKKARADKAYELACRHLPNRPDKDRFEPGKMKPVIADAIREISSLKLGPRIAQREVIEKSISNIRDMLMKDMDPEAVKPKEMASLMLAYERGNEALAKLVKIADGLAIKSDDGDDDDDTDVGISDTM